MEKSEVECDAEHLLMAEEIKGDAVRFAAAKKYLEQKKNDINSIQDIKDASKEENSDNKTEEDKATEQYVEDIEERHGDPYKEAKKETKVGKSV